MQGKAVGKALFDSKRKGGLTTAPIQPSLSDNTEVMMLKSLIGAMISYNPCDRPSASLVLDHMTAVIGKCTIT